MRRPAPCGPREPRPAFPLPRRGTASEAGVGRRGGWAEWLSRERLLSAILIPGGSEKDDPVGGPPVRLPPPSSTFLRCPRCPGRVVSPPRPHARRTACWVRPHALEGRNTPVCPLLWRRCGRVVKALSLGVAIGEMGSTVLTSRAVAEAARSSPHPPPSCVITPPMLKQGN